MLKINSNELLKYFDINHKSTINGLQKYSCEVCVYTPNNMFFIQSPQFSRELDYFYWDLGFLDVKNMLFFELGLLIREPIQRDLFFSIWVLFLQLIIDKKVYLKLFETFNFNKGILTSNDRLMYEPAFIRAAKLVSDDMLPVDFLIYLCDLMKDNQKMVSFTILKKKIASNLKNFQL